MNRKSRILFRITAALLGALTLASCHTVKNYRQIGLIESDNVKMADASYVYTSEDLDIYYNFWSDGGEVSFCVQNKTDKTIALDMTKSFFVRNGYAFDYYKDVVYGSSSSSTTNAYTRSYSYIEKPVIYIPAHSSKCINKYNAVDERYVECGFAVDPDTNEVLVKRFEGGEEFVRFSNNLTFVIDGAEKEVVNNFRVSKVGNIGYEEAVTYGIKTVCRKTSIPVVYETYSSPNAYYIDYSRVKSDDDAYRNGQTEKYNARNPAYKDDFFK